MSPDMHAVGCWFHTTALCARTWQALLTGRNHHSLGMGSTTETTTCETGSTVTPDYTPVTSRFTGKVQCVQVDLGDDDLDHDIEPEERLRIAMARQ